MAGSEAESDDGDVNESDLLSALLATEGETEKKINLPTNPTKVMPKSVRLSQMRFLITFIWLRVEGSSPWLGMMI